MSGRLAIQLVRIAWTKWDRGARPGAIRNRIPRHAPFAPPHDSARGWLHRIDHDALASPHYRRTERMCDLADLADWELPVQSRFSEGHVWLRPRFYIQKPNRKAAQLGNWLVRLPFGQRAIIRANTAVDFRRQRNYYEYSLTVGFADTATLDLPLFRDMDERVLLY